MIVSVERALDLTPGEPFALASLLVSVRSPQRHEPRSPEARRSSTSKSRRGVRSGARSSVWQAVRAAVPRSIPVSVASGRAHRVARFRSTRDSRGRLGRHRFLQAGPCRCARRLGRALGSASRRLAGQRDRISRLGCRRLSRLASGSAPHPDAIIAAAAEMPECRAVLFDTWSKSTGACLDSRGSPRIERVRDSGTAGRARRVARCRGDRTMDSWQPDIFAVRGAACSGATGSGRSTRRVAQLVDAITPGRAGGCRAAPAPSQMSNRTPWASGSSRP